jgi:hypothetical protein
MMLQRRKHRNKQGRSLKLPKNGAAYWAHLNLPENEAKYKKTARHMEAGV